VSSSEATNDPYSIPDVRFYSDLRISWNDWVVSVVNKILATKPSPEAKKS